MQRYKNSFNIYKKTIKIYKKCVDGLSELAIFDFFPYLCSHKIDKYGKENLPNRLTPITGNFVLPRTDNDAGLGRRYHRDTIVRRGIAACAGRLRPAL